MKTIIKIVLALAVLTAAFQAARASLANYQFEDSVHEALLFNPRAADQEIIEAVSSLALSQGIPVEPGNIRIRQVGPDLIVDISYETEVQLLPGIYSRNFTFKPSASTRLMPGVRRSPTR
ncbi:MAG: hypothetical protein Q7R30_07380 [Acidobacteriota bacterium]|nr:hypothetical protein [Acidobacteriota bacterium]